MFWKSKNRTEPELFTFETDCRREYVRVTPPPWAPVDVEFGDETAPLVDISAGGFSCGCSGGEKGEVRAVRIHLPGESVVISGQAEIRALSEKATHAKFLDLTPAMLEAIHHYVLNVQKNILKMKKERGEEEFENE